MVKINVNDNTNVIEPIAIDENIIDCEYINSKQSANVLFKFMKEFKYLKDILTKMAILPRYYEETIDYLDINSLAKIAFPMICFCDINLSKLEEHVHYYGKFGIGFNKSWAIKNGVQPIQYINKNSFIKNDISLLFSKALDDLYNNNLNNDLSNNEYLNYMLSHLLLMKPLIGKMRREGYYDTKNFTDEKEWRFIPKIEEKHGIDLIIPLSYIENEKAYNSYSDGITQIEELWLKFEIDDIEYLMVENDKYRKRLIKFIMNIEILDKMDRYILISKIVVYDIMNKDW